MRSGPRFRNSLAESRKSLRYPSPKDETAHVVPARKRKIATTKLPPGNPKPGDEWINSLGMVFCWCPPGKFRMGIDGPLTPQTQDAAPVDTLISKGFWISKYELTLGDYGRARKRNPEGREMVPLIHNQPITGIKGPSALKFGRDSRAGKKQAVCQRVGVIASPTEAEWEYAYRASAFRFCSEIPHANFIVKRCGSLSAPGRRFLSLRRLDGQRRDGSASSANWFLPAQRLGNSRHARQRFRIRAGPIPDPTSWRNDPLGDVEKRSNIVIRGGTWCSLAAYCQSGFRLM